jgi:hypothetical protein
VGGFLTWKFAPQTAGIGTNAAIRAFHNSEKLNFKTSIFKLITSAITIGGGLTSGREGPIAQIGASTGASIANLLKLSARERNIALAAGLGAGIAAIFKAPLAGAIIAAEIFYKEDFEVEALVPALIAAVVGYTIVGAATGFQPVFTPPPQATQFDHPWTLILFALLGVGCALLARFLFTVYFYLEKFFKRFPLWAAAAIGGFCTGMIGLLVPSVIGTGYGWAQFAISQDVQLLPPLMLLLAAVGGVLNVRLRQFGRHLRSVRGHRRHVWRGLRLWGRLSLSLRGAASRHLCDRRHDCFLCRRRQSSHFHDHHDFRDDRRLWAVRSGHVRRGHGFHSLRETNDLSRPGQQPSRLPFPCGRV